MDASQLMNYKNWVVCGNVTDESKFAHKILNSLKLNHYKACGYHPLAKDGSGVYNKLKDIPFNIHVLNLCVNPERGLSVVKEAHEVGVKRIIAQPGSESEKIKDYCEKNDMEYVEGCTLVELSKL